MRFPKRGVEAECVCPRVPGLPNGYLRRQGATLRQLRIGHSHTGVRQGIPRIPCDCSLEVHDGPLHGRRSVLDEPMPALDVELVGLDVARWLLPDAGLLVDRKLSLERGRDVQRYIGLDHEDVGQLPVVGFRP